MIAIDQNEYPSGFGDVFKRYLYNYDYLHTYDNYRIVNPDDAIEEMNDETDDFIIYSQSVPSGSTDLSWRRVESIMLDGVNIIKEGEKQLVLCSPQSVEGAVIITDDEGFYIGCRKNNVLLISMELSDLTIVGLEKILETAGLRGLSVEEMFITTLREITSRHANMNVQAIKEKIQKIDSHMNVAFSKYVQYMKEKSDLEAMISGLGEYNALFSSKLEQQLKRLYRSPKIDSVEISDGEIKVLTKPLYWGIWNIGQYNVVYNVECSEPMIYQLSAPPSREVMLNATNSRVRRSYEHSHILGGIGCWGNWREMVRSFWKLDMLTGFNYAIQYIQSYSLEGGPHQHAEKFLAGLGYIHDAERLRENGWRITQVSNGIVEINRMKRTNEELREMGFTAEVEMDPEKYKEEYERNRGIRRMMRDINIDYIDLTQVE